MLLAFIVSQRGIEANPGKITAIDRMRPIQNMKGVQHVTGCLAALSWFISHLDEHVLPLYKLLNKSDHFLWTPEAQAALDNVKTILRCRPSWCLRPLENLCFSTSLPRHKSSSLP